MQMFLEFYMATQWSKTVWPPYLPDLKHWKARRWHLCPVFRAVVPFTLCSGLGCLLLYGQAVTPVVWSSDVTPTAMCLALVPCCQSGQDVTLMNLWPSNGICDFWPGCGAYDHMARLSCYDLWPSDGAYDPVVKLWRL
jgi:hypothetical protein